MRTARAVPFAVLCLLIAGASRDAFAQRAVARPKDAQPQTPDSADDDDTTPSPTPSAAPQQAQPNQSAQPSKPSSSSSTKKASSPKTAPVQDAGAYVKPTLKDDLTADEIKRNSSAATAVDCNANPCERLTHRRDAKRELLLRLRPAQPRVGEVAEVIVEGFEVLEEADPEMGDKKPMENLKPTGHLEGVGQFALVPVSGSAGSYGFHFTPEANGLRRFTVSGLGANEDFEIPIGQPGPAPGSVGSEVRLYDPRPGLDEVGQQMAELGAAWGGLSAIAQGSGHGDAVALAKIIQRLAKAGAKELPANTSGPRQATYAELAKAFAESSGRLTGATGGALRSALTEIDDKHCNRCHAAFAWGLTDDVSDWPSFKVAGSDKGEGE